MAVIMNIFSHLDVQNLLLNKTKYAVILIVNTVVIGLWGINCARRILVKRVRRYVVMMASLILLFLLLKTVKYYVTHDGTVYNRILWYMYYIPMILIPYYAILAVSLCGKGDDAEPSKVLRGILLVPSIIMMIIVLTNELHGLVFDIYPDFLTSGDYGYHPLYYVVVVWIFLLIIISLVMGVIAGRTNKRRLAWHWVLLIMAIAYSALYAAEGLLRKRIFDYIDLTFFYTMLTVIMIELFIYCGLIPVNSDYEWCFKHASLNMQILDNDGRPHYVSENASKLDADTFGRLLSEHGHLEDGGLVLDMQEIRGGYAVIASDKSRLGTVREETERANEELGIINDRLKESIANAGKKEGFVHGSMLYRRCFDETKEAFLLCRKLIKEAKKENLSDEERSRLLKLLNIHGAYIKRRSNLVILNDGQSENAGGEFVLCLHETFNNLRLYGIEVNSSVKELKSISIEEVIYAYDVLERILMKALTDIRGIYMIVAEGNGENLITIQLDTGGRDISEHLSEPDPRISCEFDEEGVTVRIRLSGAR